MTNPRDRRSHPRFASRFPLRCRQIPTGETGSLDATVEDLSAGGVRFRCSVSLRARSGLLLELLVPGQQPVRSFGRAAWVRVLPNGEGFEIGGRFEDQSTAARLSIERLLSQQPPDSMM